MLSLKPLFVLDGPSQGPSTFTKTDTNVSINPDTIMSRPPSLSPRPSTLKSPSL